MARFFWSREAHAWVEYPTASSRPRPMGPYVIADIEPYRNVLDGKRIQSRRHHRDFLRAHRLIEVGNEYDKGLPIDSAPRSNAMNERARRDAIEQAYSQVQQGGGRKVAGREGEFDG